MQIDKTKEYSFAFFVENDQLKIYVHPKNEAMGIPVFSKEWVVDDMQYYVSGENVDMQNTIIDNYKVISEDEAVNLCPLNVSILKAREQQVSNMSFDINEHEEYLNVFNYSAEKSLEKITKYNKEELLFDGDTIASIMLGGQLIDFKQEIGLNEQFKAFAISRDGIERLYDEYGQLKSLALEDGTEILYADGQVAGIKRVENGVNYTIEDIVLDENENILDCTVNGDDGSVTLYESGQIKTRTDAYGNVYDYLDGKIDTLEESNGNKYKYTYEYDGNTYLGYRKDLVEYKLGENVFAGLINGNLDYVRKGLGYLRNLDLDEDNNIVSCTFGDTSVTAVYENGEFTEIRGFDGKQYIYKDNLLQEIIDVEGNVKKFTYIYGDNSLTFEKIIVSYKGYDSCFNLGGFVEYIEGNGCKITYKDYYEVGGFEIATIEDLMSGVVFYDPVFDENANMISGSIESGQEKFEYQDGYLYRYWRDPSVYVEYSDIGLVKALFFSGKRFSFEYEEDDSGNTQEVWVTYEYYGTMKTQSWALFYKTYSTTIKILNITNFICGDWYWNRLSDFNFFAEQSVPGAYPSICFNIEKINLDVTDLQQDLVFSVGTYFFNERKTWRETNQKDNSGAILFASLKLSLSGLSSLSEDGILIRLKEPENLFSDERIICEKRIYPTDTYDLYSLYKYFDQYSDFFGEIKMDIVIEGKGQDLSGSLNIAELQTHKILDRLCFFAGYDPQSFYAVNDQKNMLYELDNYVDKSFSYYQFLGVPRDYREFVFPDLSHISDVRNVSMQYNSKNELVRITKSDGSYTDFTDSKPDLMTNENGTIVDYQYDGYVLKKAIVFPENDLINPDVIAEYEGNKIKKAIKNDIEYLYVYEMGEDGKEITIVENSKNNNLYYYKEEQLFKTIAEDGVETHYTHDNGQICSSEVFYKGELIDTFVYTYELIDFEGEQLTLTVIRDEKGIKRMYNRDNLLVFVETETGLRYKYNYITDTDENKDYVEVELYQATGENGTIVYHKQGHVDRVVCKDGIEILVDDDPDTNTIIDNMVITDGIIDHIEYTTGEVATYIRDEYGQLETILVEKDNEKRWYNPEGELLKTQCTDIEYFLYGYAKNEIGQIEGIKKTRVQLSQIAGATLPVKVYAYSAGYDAGRDSGVFVDGIGEGYFNNTNYDIETRDITGLGRGIDVIVIDDITGEIIKKDIFDLVANDVESVSLEQARAMKRFIDSVDEGDFVIITVADSAMAWEENHQWITGPVWGVDVGLQQTLQSIGSDRCDELEFRSSWSIIGRKGAAPGEAIESIDGQYGKPVFVQGYTQEEFFYDKFGNAVSAAEFYGIDNIDWQTSIRPTLYTPEITPITTNANGDICGYIKNFNTEHADSGFIRLNDNKGYTIDYSVLSDIDDMVGNKQKKAVYYDESYPNSWMNEANCPNYSQLMKKYFEDRGYEVIDAKELRAWMQAKGDDSVVVMAQDIIPATICNIELTDTTVKDYLEKAGTIVWTNDIPFYYLGYSDGSTDVIGERGQKVVLGITVAVEPRLGEEGERRYTEDNNIDYSFDDLDVNAQDLDIGQEKLFFDFSPNYTSVDWHKIKASIGYELEMNTSVVSGYDAQTGTLLSLAKADRTVSFYNEEGKIERVTNLYGDTISEYTYDVDGRLIEVEMVQSRREVAIQCLIMKDNIAAEKIRQIQELYDQHSISYQSVSNQFDTAIAEQEQKAEAARNRYNDLKDEWCWFWEIGNKNRKMAEALQEEVQAVANAAALREQKVVELAKLDVSAQTIEDNINSETENALNEADIQKEAAIKQIALAEIEPVIYEHYRDVLGRDPSESEVSTFLDDLETNSTYDVNTKQFTIDIEVLRTSLLNGTEYTTRSAMVTQVCTNVKTDLESFIAMDTEQKQVFLSSLGLTKTEIVEITQENIDIIYTWLNEQNINFARCSVVMLAYLFDIESISYDSSEVLKQVVLVDILAGVINEFVEGNIKLSMYAIEKIARVYGLELYASKIDIEKLKQSIATYGSAVCWVNQGHYIVVTKIDDALGEVTYFEPSKGESGESVTITIEKFESAWVGGYVMLRAPPSDENDRLSSYQSKKIKGAFFGIIVAIFSFIFTVVSAAIAAIVTAVTAVISGLVGLATTLLQGVLTVFQGLLTGLVQGFQALAGGIVNLAKGIYGLGQMLFAGVKEVGLALVKGLGFGNAFGMGTAATGAASAAGGTSFASTVMTTVVKTVVGYGINMGLEGLGVNPVITNFISSFVSGGIVGGGGNVGSFFSLQNAFSSLAINATAMIGEALDIHPSITNLLSMTAGSLVNGMLSFEGLTSGVLTEIGINVASELAYIGVTEIGNLLGIDPNISYLAGAGLRSGLSAGLYNGLGIGAGTGGGSPGFNVGDFLRGLWDGAINGVKQGATQVILQLATDSLNLPPLVGSLVSNMVGSSLEAMLNHQNIFINVGSKLGEGVMSLFTLGGTSDDPWGQAVYLAKIQDFAKKIQNDGILSALEEYLTGIFYQDTVNMILANGGILDMVTGRAEVIEDPETGKLKKRLYASYQKNYYVDVDMETGLILEKFEKIKDVEVKVKQSYKKVGDVYVLDEKIVTETYSDGLEKIVSFDGDGNIKGINLKKDGKEFELVGNVLIDEKNNIYSGLYKDMQTGQMICFEEGQAVTFESLYDDGQDLTSINVNAQGVMSSIFENSQLNTEETLEKMDIMEDLVTEIDKKYSYLYNNSTFDEMVGIAHEFLQSDGNLDLTQFGDSGYWSSMAYMCDYYYDWSDSIVDVLDLEGITTPTTYEAVIKTTTDNIDIASLRGNTAKMSNIFDLFAKIADKARGLISDIDPTSMILLKTMDIWTSDAYAFTQSLTDIKVDGMNFVQDSGVVFDSLGRIMKDESSILTESFWSGLQNGMNVVSSGVAKLQNFVSNIVGLSQADKISYLDSVSENTWKNIKATADTIKSYVGDISYISNIATNNTGLAFGPLTLLGLIGQNTNWEQINFLSANAFELGNNFYDIATMYLNKEQSWMQGSNWWESLENMISDSTWWHNIANNAITSVLDFINKASVEVVTIGLKYLTDSSQELIDMLTPIHDEYIMGYDKLLNTMIQIGIGVGVDFTKDNKFVEAMYDSAKWIMDRLVSMGINTKEQLAEFFLFEDPVATVKETSSSTIMIDQNLNVCNLSEYLLMTSLDLATFLAISNPKWDLANLFASSDYKNAVISKKYKGISLSGINDNGILLDHLTQELSKYINCSFTITHSAGSGVLIKSDVATDKVIICSPQVRRDELEAWIDKVGLSPEDVIVIDVEGDLPFRPLSLINMDPLDIINHENLIDPTNAGGRAFEDLINDNAYNDYSANPNGKYTYIKIEPGDYISGNPIVNHGLSYKAMLTDNESSLDLNNMKYNISVNGTQSPARVSLAQELIDRINGVK
ncbi:MAG: interleukin-like EMT inducer domain-containing protein [Candidatus Omnitrophica bacterium]|nr:interleukin-like EMT inducer domain-containing protein [Candidatus Omnitrophota bacterium]